MASRATVLLLALVQVLAAQTAQDTKIILGVLEDRPGTYDDPRDARRVRVAFEKPGRDWKAFPSDCPDQSCLKSLAPEYPQAVVWTISFDGKNLGRVTGRTPQQFDFYSTVGQQEITSPGRVPTIGKKSIEFAGIFDQPVYRPLVANSQPYFTDPDVWKLAPLSDDLAFASRRMFRKKFPKALNCTRRNQEAATATPWSYLDGDIKIRKTYSSARGWWLVQVRLEEYLCEGPPDDLFQDQWFVIDPQKSVRFLGAGMLLVDAGDYDNCGKSEVLFSLSQYNRGGYRLFYDDFTKQAAFEFSYH